jgi:hypothetical protein
VGALGHYFEASGIATTQISLIRVHTEKMRPPRALWVPFELGRPFGPPNDVEFQTRVLMAVLALLEADDGPLIVDFPDDAPPAQGELSGWVCPLNLGAPVRELSGAAAIEATLHEEIAQFAPWYDRAVEVRKRTTVGVSGLEVADIASLFASMFADDLPASPRDDMPLADMLRLGAEDLKAYYMEAASAQPGEASVSQLADWFWQETRAGEVLKKMQARCLASGDDAVKFVGQALLIPRSQVTAE